MKKNKKNKKKNKAVEIIEIGHLMDAKLNELPDDPIYIAETNIRLRYLDDSHLLCEKITDLSNVPYSSPNQYSSSIEFISFMKGLESAIGNIKMLKGDPAINFVSEDQLYYGFPLQCKSIREALEVMTKLQLDINIEANKFRNTYYDKYLMGSLSVKKGSTNFWPPFIKMQ